MMQRRFIRAFGGLWLGLGLGLGGAMLSPSQVRAENWLLVETRKVPSTCAHPLICLPQSKLASRQLLNLSQKNRQGFYDFLNSVASVNAIPDSALAGLHPPDIAQLHALDLAPKLKPLIDHPGVYFDGSKLDGGALTGDFSALVRQRLRALGLRLLTEAEWEKTPGRPQLSIRFTTRLESAGCIVPFAVYMTLKEEVVLIRDPSQKIEATIWSTSRRQNLANTNYSPQNALREVLEKFETDWTKANDTG